MSFEVQCLQSHLDFFPEILSEVSEQQGEPFNQERESHYIFNLYFHYK
jgi:hypothetical protein